MDPKKKPRGDSKLDSLPAHQKTELRDKLLANASYPACMEWLEAECGVVIKSKSTLNTFYARHCAPVIRDKRQVHVLKSEALGDAMLMDPAKWDDAIVDQVKQRVFEFLDSSTATPMDLMMLVDAFTKANKDKRDDEKVALDREKFEETKRKARAADAAAEQLRLLKAGGKMMPEAERDAILGKMDEILGLKKK